MGGMHGINNLLFIISYQSPTPSFGVCKIVFIYK
jgi:hypothetical protein